MERLWTWLEVSAETEHQRLHSRLSTLGPPATTLTNSMHNYLSDLVHAARTLSRARAFTTVCVVSLGLGMGVVMAILLFMRMVMATPPRVDDRRLVEFVARPSGQLRAQAGNAILD